MIVCVGIKTSKEDGLSGFVYAGIEAGKKDRLCKGLRIV